MHDRKTTGTSDDDKWKLGFACPGCINEPDLNVKEFNKQL